MLSQAMVGEAMQRVMANERLSPEALAALQQQRLRDLVKFATQHSTFYADLFAGIDPDRFAISELPPVSKTVIQENFDRVVTDQRIRLEEVKQFCRETDAQEIPWYLGEFCALLTSGTTGSRGHYVWDAGALAEAVAVGFRQSNRKAASGPPAPQRIAAVVQIDVYDATNILLSVIPDSVGETLVLDIRDDFDDLCRRLQDFQPTLLASYPYMLWLLAEAQQQARGGLNLHPQRITSSADVLNESDRRAIQAAFGVDVFNYYCSTEFPYIAWECEAHQGLHVNADTLILESVDQHNQPVPAGKLGDKVLITSLSNRVLPLIRYEMSDQVEFASEPCPCGCVLPRIRTVAGREEHILSLPGQDGRVVRLIEEYVDSIVGPKPEVATYQVIQEAPDRLTVNAVPRPPATWEQVCKAMEDGFGACFEKYGVARDQIHVSLHNVQQLEPISAGTTKVCRFWNRM